VRALSERDRSCRCEAHAGFSGRPYDNSESVKLCFESSRKRTNKLSERFCGLAAVAGSRLSRVGWTRVLR
jgi:hypothetical protein